MTNKLAIEDNPAVRAEILRTAGQLPYDRIKETFFRSVFSDNPQIRAVATDWILQHGNSQDAVEYYRLASDPDIKAPEKVALLHAGLKYISRLDTTHLRQINRTIRSLYRTNTDPYVRHDALLALAEYPWNFRFIRRESLAASYAPVQVGGIEALDALLRSPNYTKSIGSYRRGLKHELIGFFRDAILSGDVGKRAAAAIALRNPDPEFQALARRPEVITDLQSVANQPPQDIESHNEVLKTLALLTGAKYKPIKPKFNHPIDWFQLENLPPEPTATLSTSKGDIRIKLFPQESPGTVANFLKEARRKYYNNKQFHRLVPDFVIQGGGPRGDGYGSLQYTIRSEFYPYNYDDEGYIGMASAGLHTEGVQFFITHRPTPHLDGNYTIFGKVVEGMDVVHRLGVGDRIQNISTER